MTIRYISYSLLIALAFAGDVLPDYQEGCLSYPRICKNGSNIKNLMQECNHLVDVLVNQYGSQQDIYCLLVKILHNFEKMDHGLTPLTDPLQKIEEETRWSEHTMAKRFPQKKELAQHNLTDEQIRDSFLIPAYFWINNIREHLLNSQARESFTTTGSIIAFTIGLTIISSGIFDMLQKHDELSHFIKQSYKNFSFVLMQPKTISVPKFRNSIKSARSTLLLMKSYLKNPKGALMAYLNGVKAVKNLRQTVNSTLNAIAIPVHLKVWKTVDEIMETATHHLLLRKFELNAEVEKSHNFAANIYLMLQNTIGNYTTLMTSITKDFNQTLWKYREFERSLISKALPLNVYQLLPPTHINKSNILQHQRNIISIFKDINISLNTFLSWVRNLTHLIRTLDGGLNRGSVTEVPLWQMYEDVLQFINLYNTGDLEQDVLSFPSLVCCLAFMAHGSPSYGTYPLDHSRKICRDGIPKNFSKEYVDRHYQLATNIIISRSVRKHSTLCFLYDQVCLTQVQADLKDFFIHDPLLSIEMLPDQKVTVAMIRSLVTEQSYNVQPTYNTSSFFPSDPKNTAYIFELNILLFFVLLSFFPLYMLRNYVPKI